MQYSVTLNANGETLVGKNGLREDALRLAQEGRLVLYGGTEMTNAKAHHPCISCKSRCLNGC